MWHIKQALPLTYRSHYTDGNGQRHFAVWKMWLGQCYQIDDLVVY